MSTSICLVPYVIKIWNIEEGNHCNLSMLPLEEQDFFVVLENCLNDLENEKSVDTTRKSAIKVNRVEADDESLIIDGLFNKGTYGFAAELENIDTGEIKNRSVLDCEYIPLFFSIHFKEGQGEAILLLQKFGVFGVKTEMFEYIGKYIMDLDSNLRLRINPLVSNSYITEIIGGSLKKIRYIKYSIPDDIAEDIESQDNLQEVAEMEMVIKAKRNKFLGVPDWMSDLWQGRSSISEIIEIQGVEYDNIKVHVDIGENKHRTLNLKDIRKLRMSIELTEHIRIGRDGHPTFSSMRRETEELLPDLRSALRWSND